MGKVILDALGFEFESEYSFRDDGYVRDVVEHTIKVNRELNPNEDIRMKMELYREESLASGSLPKGMAVQSITHPSTIVIFYAKQPTPEENLMVRAHEQTHALHWMRRHDLLERELLERGYNVRISPPSFFSPEADEKVAAIGSFYALERSGLSIEQIRDLISKRGENGEDELFQAYRQSMNFPLHISVAQKK
jgi:hypothetical protein